MIVQQKCPICEGCGLVPGGFYCTLPGCVSVSSSYTEQCKNCSGTGVVFVVQTTGKQIEE